MKFKKLRFKQIAPYRWIADTSFGKYQITESFGRNEFRLKPGPKFYWEFGNGNEEKPTQTVEEAKQACREHYANALQSCIIK